ncbi:hypothetical protein [Geothrix sp. PMB-07]|uniref:hypothetical protein n=1 Tax=Geothrix sp. PMB-07 TaxID=3068640 RepID=UPI0027412B43|nr:hypothetical protein [Geothrix sp. PMB-07]WLT33584.1 hypothetical protein Q9293_16825 [Geothrix sp. PMB-07]
MIQPDRKAMGTPTRTKPMKRGTAEQEQKGGTAFFGAEGDHQIHGAGIDVRHGFGAVG